MTSPTKTTTVAPSPFNPVKILLALGILLAVILWCVVSLTVTSPLWQMLILGGYSVGLSLVLVAQVRRIGLRERG